MSRRCRACGANLPAGTQRCPGCGAVQGRTISRVWILAFFVMGVMIGLLLLVLDQGPLVAWRTLERPASTSSTAKSEQRIRSPVPPPPVAAKASPNHQPAPVPKVESLVIEPLRCDRKTALAVYKKARALASISEHGGVTELALTPQWEFYSPGHRRSFVEAFSEADRCLRGHYRELHFIYRGSEVAVVSSSGAVQMK